MTILTESRAGVTRAPAYESPAEVAKLKKVALVLYLFMLVVASMFADLAIFVSVAFGGGAGVYNLFAVEKTSRIILQSENIKDIQAKGGIILSFFFRLTLFALTLYLIIQADLVSFPALLAGLFLPVPTIFFWYILFGRRMV